MNSIIFFVIFEKRCKINLQKFQLLNQETVFHRLGNCGGVELKAMHHLIAVKHFYG